MADAPSTWTLRIVLAEGGTAAGVPVTLLDQRGDPAGHWMSDGAGLVTLPRSTVDPVQIRVGLRSEEPRTLTAAALDAGTVELVAPRSALPAPTADRTPLAPRPRPTLSTERAPERIERPDTPAHVLRYSRVLVAPPEGALTVAHEGEAPHVLDPLRHGIVIEIEQVWQSAGYVTGDMLYSAPVLPGDEMRTALLDERWPAGAPGRAVDAAAALMADALEPLALVPGPDGRLELAGAVAESQAEIADRAERAAATLRRRPVGVREAINGAPAAAVRTVRNPHADRTLTASFFEPLERFRVVTRAARVRPALLVPFRLPAQIGPASLRQFGPLLRGALLDRTLAPDLERALDESPTPDPARLPPVSELRVVAQRAPGEHGADLRQVWCFLHVDDHRYTVHFFPADAPGHGVSAPAAPDAYWIGAIRLADFHQRPLRFPGAVSIQNGSASILAFTVLHLEGRAGDRWVRLHTTRDLVLPAQSQVQLASLADLAAAPGVSPSERRLLLHLQANVAHYATAIIARGDPGLRRAALARMHDPQGRPLASLIENEVVGSLGTHVAFPLRSAGYAPTPLRAALAQYAGRPLRQADEITVTLPLPGVWLSVQAGESWGVESVETARPRLGTQMGRPSLSRGANP